MKKSAFTLIELLIVIAIVAVLSGILISVLNPKRQQQKAKDAVIIANLEKVVTAVESYQSAYGSLPTCLKLATSELVNATAGNDCTDTTSAGSFFFSSDETPNKTGFIYSPSSGEAFIYAQLNKTEGGDYVYACYKPAETEGVIKIAKSVNSTTCSQFID